ncbi:MAG: flagellar biosynthesis protein FlhA [Burkholderiales bacterium]|nr:flagellar biosynthesis protein FlhA [Burkholderiales bacterium]
MAQAQVSLARPTMQQMAAPLLIIMILAMMVLPLPPIALDLLFTFNIAMSMLVMLVALYVFKPLDFSLFPTVLLLTTLLRLSLNVASTRVVLMHGHSGSDAAGKVIEAFGHFLVGSNYAVGLVVFVILVIINFVVITKGAGRIAEVAARFTLDAMPGKQMAIDADLNAGLIGEAEARRRRQEVAKEAEFYGAMDGASKFVRGDAVAGIIIMLINIVGGLVIGTLQHGLTLAQAAEIYTLLTIGDGLVAQVPALVISTAAGILVTRVSAEQDLNAQLLDQLGSRPQVLYITAGILTVLGLIPNMPHLAFLFIAACIAGVAYWLERRGAQPLVEEDLPPVQEAPPEPQEVSWSDVVPIDVLGLEVGYRLIPLVDRNQDGELLRRIRGLRKKFAADMGFLVPSVHIRDNLELRPNAYRIALKGVDVGNGEVSPGMYMAINPGRVLGPLSGPQTRDPAFGLPAVWIEAAVRENAQAMGYTVVDASTVVATHLSSVIQAHAPELLGREETQALLDHLAKDAPKLVEDLVPKLLPLPTVQKVLQNLLGEGMHIRDMRSILECLAEHATRTQDAEELSQAVRVALGRSIVQQIYGGTREMEVFSLDPQLEQILTQASQVRGGEGPGLEPGLAERLLQQASQLSQAREQLGQPSVLLVPPVLRTLLARFLRRAAPQLRVISQAEVPENRVIKVVATLGGAGGRA